MVATGGVRNIVRFIKTILLLVTKLLTRLTTLIYET